MEKRGIKDFDKVEIVPWSAGYHGDVNEPMRRVVRAVSSYLGNATTSFTRPIEGVVAYVDLTARRVVDLTDTGVMPLPPEERGLAQPPRATLPPLEIAQPKGTGVVLDGHLVSWGPWRFRFTFHPREGLVLYTVGYMEQGKLRSILYRGSLSEMVVPYGDPSPAWYFRNVFDTGEYAFVGRSLTPRTTGSDAPENAILLDADFADEEGKPIHSEGAAALYERDGGILWRYTDLAQGKALSRRARELVLSTVLTAGNYEYGFNWVFHQDGVLELELLLTGIMTVKGVSPAVHTAGPQAHRVTDYLEAVHHQHFFNFRLDLDVDGPGENSVLELNTLPARADPADPYGKAMMLEERPLRTELEGQRQVDLASGRKWKVVNTARRNALGEPVGYMLVPGENTVPYASPSSWIRKRAAFINQHLWVTPYDPDEMNAAGTYVNQSRGVDGLTAWTHGDRPIQNRDVVLWYTLGVTHIPRPEEWPVMSVHRAGFQLVPAGFFSKNPTLER